MNETTVTVVGNMVEDPKLRTIESGTDVTNFRVASTPRRWDRAAGDWADGATLFLNVSCWRALAGNVAASMRKGDPVVVTGRLSTRSWEKDGQNHTVFELDATAVGPDLARGIAVFRRSPRPPALAPGALGGGPVDPDREDPDGSEDPIGTGPELIVPAPAQLAGAGV